MGSKRYIPQGAILICDKGRDMTHLRVTHNNNVNLYKVPYANELIEYLKRIYQILRNVKFVEIAKWIY